MNNDTEEIMQETEQKIELLQKDVNILATYVRDRFFEVNDHIQAVDKSNDALDEKIRALLDEIEHAQNESAQDSYINTLISSDMKERESLLIDALTKHIDNRLPQRSGRGGLWLSMLAIIMSAAAVIVTLKG